MKNYREMKKAGNVEIVLAEEVGLVEIRCRNFCRDTGKDEGFSGSNATRHDAASIAHEIKSHKDAILELTALQTDYVAAESKRPAPKPEAVEEAPASQET